MKALLMNSIVSLIAVMSLGSYAAPAPAPVSCDEPVAQLLIAGGLPGPGNLARRALTICVNGINVVDNYFPEDFDFSKPGRTVEQNLPPMKSEDLAKLLDEVNRLPGSPFLTNDEPRCMDAPDLHYSVFNNGSKVEIFKVEGCVELELANPQQQQSAKIVKAYLDYYNQLTR